MPAPDRRSVRRRSGLGCALASALALAGCGGEPGDRRAPESAVPAAAPGSLSGHAAPAVSGFPAVVALTPITASGAAGAGGASSATPGGEVFLDQAGSAFYPPTLLARAGQTVAFSNSETVMHNVNVAADGGVTIFNVASPPGFEPHRHAFAEPGVYRVTCDIHPNMSAFIVVTAAPWAAVAGPDGSFALEGVPPGRYLATVWSLDPGLRLEREIEVPAGAGSVSLDLVAASPTLSTGAPPPSAP